MGTVFVHLAHRYLVGAPVTFNALAVDLLWTGPALGGPQNNHGPARAIYSSNSPVASVGLNLFDLRDDSIECGRHQLVHLLRFIPFDEIRRVPVAAKELLQLLVTDARQHGGISDLVAVEMQDRQHRSIGHRVEKLIRMPACGPVSASPSPTTAATIRFGLSKAAP